MLTASPEPVVRTISLVEAPGALGWTTMRDIQSHCKDQMREGLAIAPAPAQPPLSDRHHTQRSAVGARWLVVGGGWWPVVGARWLVVGGGRWPVVGARWLVVGARRLVVGARWLVAGGRRSVVSGRWSALGGRWSVVGVAVGGAAGVGAGVGSVVGGLGAFYCGEADAVAA
ncbi:hypothetical protein [Actinomadura fulvescens]|uniref:hypothetical protein n=1 Tax=Actinomadura fulvescens TaxID=46160 RepID=UPI003CD09545